MLKILTSQQMSCVDQITIANEPIGSLDLMERASRKCTDWILDHFSTETSVAVFAGVGNNGGDALAIARHLLNAGYHLDVFIVNFANGYSSECDQNRQRLLDIGVPISEIVSADNLRIDHELIIDGIFGSGLSGPAEGLTVKVMHAINAAEGRVISIDIPSGVFADLPLIPSQTHVVSDVTLTFQSPNISSLVQGCGSAFGEMQVLA